MLVLDHKKILKIEAYTMSNKLIVSSTDFSVSLSEPNYIGVEYLVIKGDMNMELKIDQRVKIVVYLINGNRLQYNTYARLSTDYQLNVEIDENYVLLEERRRYYKIKVNLFAQVLSVTDSDDQLVSEKVINGIIRDINIGGFYLDSLDFSLSTSDIINIKINLNDKFMVASAKVLRIQKNDPENIGYGCAFIGLKAKQEEVIAKYINYIERERMYQVKKNLESRK